MQSLKYGRCSQESIITPDGRRRKRSSRRRNSSETEILKAVPFKNELVKTRTNQVKKVAKHAK
jgi:hypothetical protein